MPGEDPDIAGIVPGPQPPREDMLLGLEPEPSPKPEAETRSLALGFARLPISLSAFKDFENGLNRFVLFVAEFPLNARDHVPGPQGLVHFVFLVLKL